MPVERFRGDTKPFVVNLKTVSTGLPLDITSCSFLMTVDSVQDPPDNTTRQFQLTGSILGSPTLGVVQFLPSASETNITGAFFFDIQMTDANGYINTIKKDKIKFIQDLSF
jgi:hypothetical protein